MTTEPVSRDVAGTSVIALAAMRIGIGALAWARPELAAKLFGLPAPKGQSPYLWRLFGVRDVVVGIGTLSSTGASRRAWTTFGLVCDASDGAAAAIGGANGELPRSAARMLIAVPAAAVGLGALALRSRRD